MKQTCLLLMLFSLVGCFGRKKVVTAPPEPVDPPLLSLYTETKASRVGDLITIQIVENASGSNKITSIAEKETDISADLSLDADDQITTKSMTSKIGAKAKNNYDAESGLEKRASLIANVTAVVMEVLPTGNLRVEGEQEIILDKGLQIITVKGIVRPGDIGANNTVVSTRMANAKISYKNKRGPKIHRQGLIGRLFNIVF